MKVLQGNYYTTEQRELKGDYYTTEYDTEILDFIRQNYDNTLSPFITGFLEVYKGTFHQSESLRYVSSDATRVSKELFMKHIGMPVSTTDIIKGLVGNFYTAECDQEILDFITKHFNLFNSIRGCDGYLEVVGATFYNVSQISDLEDDSLQLTKREFMIHIGMIPPEEEDLFEADREMGILKAENQMFKDNIQVLKEHINLLEERLDIAQNNCKLRETLQQNAEQHNYVTAKKFNDTLAENHKLKEQIKQLENK